MTTTKTLLYIYLVLSILLLSVALKDTCTCSICGSFDRNKSEVGIPSLRKQMYTLSTGDGIGNVISQIIFAGAIADALNFEFAGAFQSEETTLQKHHASSTNVLDFVFGNNFQVRPTKPPPWNRKMKGIHIMPKSGQHWPWPWLLDSITTNGTVVHQWMENLKKNALGYLFEDKIFTNIRPQHMNYFIGYSYLTKLRSTSSCAMSISPQSYTQISSSRVVSIVAHFRLGDMDSRLKSVNKVFLVNLSPQEKYFKLFQAFQNIFKDIPVKCTAYTSCVSTAHCKLLQEVDVPLWKSKGISLIVDGETDVQHATDDLKKALKDMVSADVLITAKSSLSYSAALLNSNCVINDPNFHHPPLPDWISIEDPHSQVKKGSQEITRDIVLNVRGQNQSESLENQLIHSLSSNSGGRCGSLLRLLPVLR